MAAIFKKRWEQAQEKAKTEGATASPDNVSFNLPHAYQLIYTAKKIDQIWRGKESIGVQTQGSCWREGEGWGSTKAADNSAPRTAGLFCKKGVES